MDGMVAELASLELFAGCSEDDLEHVAHAVREVRRCAEGELICRAGEVGDRWWIVAEGVADVTVDGLYVSSIGPASRSGSSRCSTASRGSPTCGPRR